MNTNILNAAQWLVLFLLAILFLVTFVPFANGQITQSDFDAIRATYPELNFSEDMADYNIIEIATAQLSVENLQAAIAIAAQTEEDDLIVVCTTGTDNTLTLDGNPITIDINPSLYGAVAIVVFSDTGTPLVVNTQELSRSFRINSGNVAMGGMVILGQTWSWDVGSPYDGLIAVRGQSVLTTSNLQTVASVQPAPTPIDPMDPPQDLINDARMLDHLDAGTWTPAGAMIAGAPQGAGVYDTAEYMVGNVHVILVLLESNGVIDANEANWSPQQIIDVKTQIRRGLDWWEGMSKIHNPNSKVQLSFNINYTWANNPFATSYEPARRTDDSLWGKEFLVARGYTGNYGPYTPLTQFHLGLYDFNHDQRNAHSADWTFKNGADWAFTIFIINSRSPSGAQLIGNSYGYAYLGGPYTAMSYDNGNWGINRLEIVTAHEIGHIFYALDEYSDSQDASYHDTRHYTARSGYYNILNTNGRYGHPAPSTRNPLTLMGNGTEMPNAYYAKAASTETLRMIGWRDSNNNGILDVLDVPLTLTNTGGSYNASANTFTFSGTSSVQTLQNNNPRTWPNKPGNNITLNTVDKLQYRINSGSWTTLNTHYGGTTNVNVGATVSLAGISAGNHTIAFRTICERTGVTSGASLHNFNIVAPATPTGLHSTHRTLSTVSLAWNAVSNAASYQIQCRYPGGNWGEISPAITLNGTTAVASGLQPNTTYQFRIRARNAAGNSTWSSGVSETTDPMSAPTNFRPTGKTLTTVSFAWDSVPGATSYQIQCRLPGGDWGSVTPAITFNGKTAVASGLLSSTVYQFRIRARNAAGNSPWSSGISETTVYDIPPATPTGFDATGKTLTTISLAWDPVSGATSYQIQCRLPGGEWGSITPAIAINGTTAVASGLQPSTVYQFRIRARNAIGNSPWSTGISETTDASDGQAASHNMLGNNMLGASAPAIVSIESDGVSHAAHDSAKSSSSSSGTSEHNVLPGEKEDDGESLDDGEELLDETFDEFDGCDCSHMSKVKISLEALALSADNLVSIEDKLDEAIALLLAIALHEELSHDAVKLYWDAEAEMFYLAFSIDLLLADEWFLDLLAAIGGEVFEDCVCSDESVVPVPAFGEGLRDSFSGAESEMLDSLIRAGLKMFGYEWE